jgi:predicted murein hydrolase (TIGR00659 family)
MKELFNSNPISGMLLTFGAYFVGQFVYRKTHWTLLQPILAAIVMIIVFLMVSGISYDDYNKQNAVLNYVLSLTGVVLAIPLYRNLKILKQNIVPIIAGIASGTLVTMGTILIVGKLIGTDDVIIASMIPKSATVPIALEVSKITGGIQSITLAMVVIVGLFGAVLGPELLRLLRIKNEVAKGIAIGTLSHAVGTARAFKEGQVEGSMSSLAIAIAGTLTAILAPLLIMFLH